jgi:hypothetical protein
MLTPLCEFRIQPKRRITGNQNDRAEPQAAAGEDATRKDNQGTSKDHKEKSQDNEVSSSCRCLSTLLKRSLALIRVK